MPDLEPKIEPEVDVEDIRRRRKELLAPRFGLREVIGGALFGTPFLQQEAAERQAVAGLMGEEEEAARRMAAERRLRAFKREEAETGRAFERETQERRGAQALEAIREQAKLRPVPEAEETKEAGRIRAREAAIARIRSLPEAERLTPEQEARVFGERVATSPAERTRATIEEQLRLIEEAPYLSPDEKKALRMRRLGGGALPAPKEPREDMFQRLARDLASALDMGFSREQLVPLIERRIGARPGSPEMQAVMEATNRILAEKNLPLMPTESGVRITPQHPIFERALAPAARPVSAVPPVAPAAPAPAPEVEGEDELGRILGELLEPKEAEEARKLRRAAGAPR